MTSEEKRFDQLGTKVAESLGSGPDTIDLEVQKRRLLRNFETAARRSRKVRWLATAAVAALVIVVAGAIFTMYLGDGNERIFWIGKTEQSGRVGDWVRSQNGQTTTLAFKNGSKFTLTDDSLLQVETAQQDVVQVALMRGKLNARVKGNGVTKWSVRAGPYQVEVLGTQFTVDWHGDASVFTLEVKRGKVAVKGAGLGPGGITLEAGQRMVADPQLENFSVTNASIAAAAARSADSYRSDGSGTKGVDNSSDSSAARRLSGEELKTLKTDASTPSAREPYRNPAVEKNMAADTVSIIRKHLLNGETAQALAVAELNGLTNVTAQLTNDELWSLADFARYSGQGAVASSLLESYRNRHIGDGRSRTAAFLLGKVEIDLRGRPLLARDWFEVYLREHPGGALAEEALGRLVDACHRAGLKRETQEAGRRYLTLYPDGVFSNVVKDMLRRDQGN